MKNRINPFKPNNPIYQGLFAGRVDEIKKLDNALFQTRNENPTNILFIGERGIGKTSLLLLAKYMAQGVFSWSDEKYDFVPVHLVINAKTTLPDFVIKFHNALKRELQRINNTKKILETCWDFIKKLEIAGCKLNETHETNNEILIDDFIYSLSETVRGLTSDSGSKDGIIVIIDEVDTASKELDLGTFLKNLTETLTFEGCNKILFVLAGLPQATDKLRESHESSLRLFEEFEMKPLSHDDVKYVINSALTEINKNEIENDKLTISDDAMLSFYTYSEGYPHFLQQIGYSTISNCETNCVDGELVSKSMFDKGGALELIGNRYYVDLYYNKINSDLYRQILSIMAKKWNQWISKEEIRKSFSGSGTNLANGLKALRDRNIILTKRGQRGLYRLQWMSFAFWIKIHKSRE